ncbi:MAG: hypothetical protein ACK5Z5_04175 [Neisseriaceae bacterium]
MDIDLTYNHRYKDDYEKLRDAFNKSEEVKRGKGSSGIKKLKSPIMINNIEYTHEIKSISTKSSIYGFISPSPILNRHVLIFNHFDKDAFLTKSSSS